MAPLTIRWVVGSLILGAVVTLGLAWSLTRSGVIDPHRLDLLLLSCALVSCNLVVVPTLYWWDKRKAKLEGGLRIPESALHFFAFVGGAVAALMSQRVLRHKTRKRQFVVITWVAIACNIGLFYLGLGYFDFV